MAPFAALALGGGLGTIGALVEPGPRWMQVTQLPSAWLSVAVLTGMVATSRRGAMAFGPIAILAAVCMYYLTLLETGVRAYYDTAQRAAVVWGSVGVVCGAAMGFTGWALANWGPGFRRSLLTSVLVGWLWCEAALIWLLWAEGWLAFAAFAQAAVGVLILVYAARSVPAFLLASATALAVALLATSFGLAAWRGIDCAAGKVCS
jgi:hypothetical protein